MQAVLGIRAGRLNPAQAARSGQAEHDLLKKVLTSAFRISKAPNIGSY